MVQSERRVRRTAGAGASASRTVPSCSDCQTEPGVENPGYRQNSAAPPVSARARCLRIGRRWEQGAACAARPTASLPPGAPRRATQLTISKRSAARLRHIGLRALPWTDQPCGRVHRETEGRPYARIDCSVSSWRRSSPWRSAVSRWGAAHGRPLRRPSFSISYLGG